MAILEINSKKIIGNIEKLNSYLAKHNQKWSLVVKILAGNKQILEQILKNHSVNTLHSIADSRLSNLKVIKKINPHVPTMYIKPPHIEWVESVVECADISLNTSQTVIKALNQAALAQKKTHKIIIMIELGELREGILRENVIDFYSEVFKLSNIEVIGMGTNLGCMYGVEPTYDKLMQLSLYKELIQAKFNKKLELVSGGSSITLPLLKSKKVPPNVNHFRIGEAAFFGKSPYDGHKFRNLSTDTFNFYANIIELEKKESIPDGNIGEGNVGEGKINEDDEAIRTYRAVMDFGKIDVDYKDIRPCDSYVNFVGTSSDVTVYEIGSKKRGLSVGKQIKFNPNYMAVARLMTSKFVTKKVI